MFSKKGRATQNEICFWKNKKKTRPNEIAIKTYRNVQTGPNNHAGGDQVGLINCEYQL